MKDALAVRPPRQDRRRRRRQQPPRPEDDTKVYPVKPGDAPSKGRADAPLVMVVFSDFQCPFCKRVEPTLAELEKHYGKKLRVVWKNYPLPFHPDAEPAAEAAMAADAQGKFWPMHDKLFENNTALDRPSLERYAQGWGSTCPASRPTWTPSATRRASRPTEQRGPRSASTARPPSSSTAARSAGAYPFETFQADRRRRAGQGRGQGGQEGRRSQGEQSRPLTRSRSVDRAPTSSRPLRSAGSGRCARPR